MTFCARREAELRAAGVPEKGYEHESLDMASIAKTLQVEGPSLPELLKFSKEYTKATGKPLSPPPSETVDPTTLQLNSSLKSHFEAFEYDAMRARWLIAMRDRVIPDCETLRLMIESIVEAKTPELYEPVEGVMSGIEIPKTLPLLNAILRYSAQNLDGKRASEAFKYMLTNGIKPDIRSVDYYMQSHATPDTFPIVLEAFTKYPEKWNLTVDADMHSSFIEALLKVGKEEMAVKRYQAMEQGKSLPFPTNRTINVMMAHYLRKGDFNKVQELFDATQERFGLYPDKDGYAKLLEMKMALGLHDEARQIVLRLCGERWPVSASVINQLMTHYLGARDFSWVEKLWSLIPKARTKPTIEHLAVVFAACVAQQKPDRALAYMVIAHDKYGVIPIRAFYAALISLFGANHDLAKSLTLYRRMVFTDKIMPGPTTFLALLNAYIHNGEMDTAKRILKNPDAHGIPRINRHHFEAAIDALEAGSSNPLQSLFEFDWTRLEGVTSETMEDLTTLNSGLQPGNHLPPQVHSRKM